ncbi:MAG: sugar phosphate isomerase/epimerase [Verrucomicrobia bacterium]|nr:sugar phosphate isomerase/epimerase [Verrucomicrobiota bacterium]
MKLQQFSRREAVVRAGVVLGAALTGRFAHAADTPESSRGPIGSPFVFCLNTGTIRGQKLGLAKEAEVAAKAGFNAIEPWVSSIEEFVKGGGALKDLKKQISDLGLTVESAIGFPQWIVDDDEKRAKGLERAKFEMDLVAQIGGQRLAAPPAGATDTPGLDLVKAAERYRALLDAGDQIGVVPQIELWGFSKNLNRLGPCAFVAIESGHPKGCVLADVFHLYKGGCDFRSLRLLSGHAIQVFHINDYPAEPPRDKINDSFRVFPGDGVAPITQVLRDLASLGGKKVLSLELFNREYWKQDALDVAKAGLDKMKTAVAKAMG